VVENVVAAVAWKKKFGSENDIRKPPRRDEGGNAKHPPHGSSTLKSESNMKLDLRDV
jgi:hypothetical protein